jgi:hypothetical protein
MADDLKNKFVAVLNKKIPVNILMNALGHMAVGLSSSYLDIAEMRLDSYIDKDGNDHKSISDNPFIILRAKNSNKIRNLRQEFLDKGIHFVDFTNTMTVGTYEEQKQRTKETKEEDLEYYGICAFGDKKIINPLTKKFSLWGKDL